MNLSRNNHYVPRMYLKNWATNEKIKIYDLLVSDKNVPLWRERSIKKTAFSPNLYYEIEKLRPRVIDEDEFKRIVEIPRIPTLGIGGCFI